MNFWVKVEVKGTECDEEHLQTKGKMPSDVDRLYFIISIRRKIHLPC